MRALDLRLAAAICLLPLSLQAVRSQDVEDACALLRSPLLDAWGYTGGRAVPLSRQIGIGAMGNRIPFYYSGCFHGNDAAASALDRLLRQGGDAADQHGDSGQSASRGAALMIQSFSDEQALAREQESTLQEATLDLPQAAPDDAADDPREPASDRPVATLLYAGGACGTWDQPETPALAMAARREVACSLTRGRHEIGLSLFDVLPQRLPTMQQVKDLIDGIAARLR